MSLRLRGVSVAFLVLAALAVYVSLPGRLLRPKVGDSYYWVNGTVTELTVRSPGGDYLVNIEVDQGWAQSIPISSTDWAGLSIGDRVAVKVYPGGCAVTKLPWSEG